MFLSWQKKIRAIIPEEKKNEYRKHLYFSLLNSFLDLLSVALMVPILLTLLDKEKSVKYLSPYASSIQESQLSVVLIALVVVVYVIKSVVQFFIVRNYSRFIFDLSTSLSLGIAKRHLAGSHANAVGDKLSSFYHNVRVACIDFATKILFANFSILTESSLLIVLLITSAIVFPLLTAVVFFFGFLFSLLVFLTKKRGVMNHNKKYIHDFNENTDEAFNIFHGAADITLMGTREVYIKSFEDSLKTMNNHQKNALVWRYSNHKFMELFSILFLVVGILIYGYLKGDYNPIVLSFFGAILFKFLPSFIKLLNAYTDFKSFEHVIDIIGNALSKKLPIRKVSINYNKKITLENVAFEFTDDRKILDKVNLEARSGDFVGIHGNSGLGKSTLLKIIAGFLKPKKGNIYFDDNLLTEDQSLSENIALVSQQPYIFKGSIRENIFLTKKHDDNVDLTEVHELLSFFGLSDIVSSSEGLLKLLDANDSKLSTGEKQRLAFVRALYSKPKLLLLDEATSHIEPQLEEKIFEYLKEKCCSNGLSIICVTHNVELSKYFNKSFKLIYGGDLICI